MAVHPRHDRVPGRLDPRVQAARDLTGRIRHHSDASVAGGQALRNVKGSVPGWTDRKQDLQHARVILAEHTANRLLQMQFLVSDRHHDRNGLGVQISRPLVVGLQARRKAHRAHTGTAPTPERTSRIIGTSPRAPGPQGKPGAPPAHPPLRASRGSPTLISGRTPSRRGGMWPPGSSSCLVSEESRCPGRRADTPQQRRRGPRTGELPRLRPHCGRDPPPWDRGDPGALGVTGVTGCTLGQSQIRHRVSQAGHPAC